MVVSLSLQSTAHASLAHAKLGNSLPNSNVHGGGLNPNDSHDDIQHSGQNGGGGGGSGGFGGGAGGNGGDNSDFHGLGPRAGGNPDGLGGDGGANDGWPGNDGPNQLAGDFPPGGHDGDLPGDWHDGPAGDGPGYFAPGEPTTFADPLGDQGDTPDALAASDDPTDVPEPSSLALVAGALLGAAFMRRRKLPAH